MRYGIRLVGLVAAVGLFTGADLLACGDKFLVAGRGTRYQRPKSARAASVLIYANPSSGLPTAVGSVPVESVLRRQGHRSATAETLQQLTALLAGGRYDVILAASTAVAAVENLLAGPDAPVVVAVRAPLKERPLLEAIDKAVEQHDRNARRVQARS
ncbi:MAG: hypothetical protein DMF80_05860 [Acidobacteria bacterium]|nr:MAG: hypothetical protein DMF80_05860 [Acidobacteriota bacterium]PYQ25017.1 MAG: hypothetical protein DMF81_03720 [Acidobacteriota bacterium]